MYRYLTAGESHGPALTIIAEGLPSGIPVTEETVNSDLRRRQQGYGRGGRMKIERDRIEFIAGVRGGYTLGSPVAMRITNRDWSNWEAYMTPGPDADLETRKVTGPRPGHADLAGAIKYRQEDMRNILERSSARETAARVAAGALARELLRNLDVELVGCVVQIGDVKSAAELTWEQIALNAPKSEVFCADKDAAELMKARIDRAKEEGDTLGGIFEIYVRGLPVGLGSHVHWDRRLDGLLAQAVMSIPAIKGVEIGWGFRAAVEPGSIVHDAIYYDDNRGFYRKTNHAGGLEGGMTNGEVLIVRAAMKPIPTLMRALWSVDFVSKEPRQASVERSDICAVPAASVVGEAAVAIVLANSMLEKFGGDNIEELSSRVQEYRSYVARI